MSAFSKRPPLKTQRTGSVSTTSSNSLGSSVFNTLDHSLNNDYESMYKTCSTNSEYYYRSRANSSFCSDISGSRTTFHDNLPTRSQLEQWPEENDQQVFPQTEEMERQARDRLSRLHLDSPTPLFSGNVTYKTDKGILSKTKHVYFVLTHKHLLVYKTAQKAQIEIDTYSKQSIDKSRIFLDISYIYAVHGVIASNSSFRIDYLHHQSNQSLFYTFTVETNKECRQWIQAFCLAVSKHHPLMQTVAPAEKYASIDRLSKQKDNFENTDDMKMYKVVFKEKRYKASDTPREFFLPVILMFGKFSFYLLPVSVMNDEYLKTVERDRFGYLSIESIRYDGFDDTVCVQVRQIDRKSRQLVFASTFCKDIVCNLSRAIQSIFPYHNLFQFKVPESIKKTNILPIKILPDPDDELTGYDDKEMQMFNITLRAYAAALNLNKLRFKYSIEGSSKKKKFVLLPPKEINSSQPVYQKHELLALFKTIQANTFFQQVSLSGHPLDSLENWKMEANDSWSVHTGAYLKDNVLSNLIHNLLISNKSIHKLDLSNCSIGNISSDGTSTSAISAIGMTMMTGSTALSRLSLGQNRISERDFECLVNGIQRHQKSIKELYLNDCGLNTAMAENIINVLLEKNPEQLTSLDLSSNKEISIDPDLIAKFVPTFKHLEILRMGGYDLLNPKYDFGLEICHLRELDLSGVSLSRDTVSRLCQWIRQPSFQTIEALHLARCGMNGRFVYEILCSISRSGKRNMHLNLAENPIMKEVIHLPKLYSAIIQGEGPYSISFSGIEWDDSNLCEFIDCLRDNQTISHLTLSDIRLQDTKEISTDTVQILTSFFERNTMIRELNLSYNKYKPARSHFSPSDSKSLFAVALNQAIYGLRHNCVLQQLDISGLNIGDTGALALSRTLGTNRTLQSINIDDNSITIEGYKHLVKVIQETATQVIDIPMPHNDLRFQMARLAYRIEELTLSQNESQFFLIHTSSGERKRAKMHDLEILMQERKSCELALKNIEDVVNSLMIAVQKNLRHFEDHQNRSMKLQLQAQTVAEELAVAQVRLQCRSPSLSSSASSLYKKNSRSSQWIRRRSSFRENFGMQYYLNTQLPATPSDNKHEILEILGPLSSPMPSYTDDPGFINDFGYIDNYELEDATSIYFQNDIWE